MGYLIVVLAHDRHNNRPYAVASEERKNAVEKLGIADEVVVGDPESFAGVLLKYRPDIILLGYDQELPDRETGRLVRELSKA
jgi:glycerol-3-phosphate cytidylyltransferase-like family protein